MLANITYSTPKTSNRIDDRQSSARWSTKKGRIRQSIQPSMRLNLRCRGMMSLHPSGLSVVLPFVPTTEKTVGTGRPPVDLAVLLVGRNSIFRGRLGESTLIVPPLGGAGFQDVHRSSLDLTAYRHCVTVAGPDHHRCRGNVVAATGLFFWLLRQAKHVRPLTNVNPASSVCGTSLS